MRRDDRGVVLIIFAVSVTVIFVIAAIAVGLGNARQEDRDVQNDIDAALLAAAAELDGNVSTSEQVAAVARACEYLVDNGHIATCDSSMFQYPVDANGNPAVAGDDECIGRTLDGRNADVWFGGATGTETLALSARALGCREAASGTSGTPSSVPAIAALSENCNNAIDWSGSDTYITGDVHTNNDLHVGGQSNVIEGTTTYVSSVDAPDDKITYIPGDPHNPNPATPISSPVDFELDDYKPGGSQALAAIAAGEYYAETDPDEKIDKGWLEDRGLIDASGNITTGLYYSAGDIDLSASNLAGTTTFVAEGTVSFSGSSHDLHPYVDGLLAFSTYQKFADLDHNGNCNAKGIKMSGSSQIWTGIIYAPFSAIEFSGSSNTTVNGSLIGLTVALNGSEINITWQQTPSCCGGPAPDPRIFLGG